MHGYMSTLGLRTGLALAVAAMAVALTGCGARPHAPASPTPPDASSRPGQGADPGPGSAQASEANAGDGGLPPDSDGHPACPAYDGWGPSPGGAGITVTYWYEGLDPVTVLVRHSEGPDLSQTADSNDVSQRYHDFAFLDADPTAVTEVLATTGPTTCYVRAAPS